MKLHCVVLPFILIINTLSCRDKVVKNHDVTPVAVDTIARMQDRDDSICYFTDKGVLEKVVYKNVKEGDVHYKKFFRGEFLLEIGYLNKRNPFGVQASYKVDSVITYNQDGTSSGYMYNVYFNASNFDKAEGGHTIWTDSDSRYRLISEPTIVDLGDSVYYYDANNYLYKVVYRNVKGGDVHYKKILDDEPFFEVGYVKHKMMYDIKKHPDLYPCMDSVIVYYKNAVIGAKGYVVYFDSLRYDKVEGCRDLWMEYNELGIIRHKTKPYVFGSMNDCIWEYYYDNGNLKERRVGTGSFVSGATVESAEWYPTGEKKSETKYDNRLPENPHLSNSVFSVMTTTEFYKSGVVKSVQINKTYAEAGKDCPCGNWKFYDKNGELVRTEKHKPCYNFELDCPD